MNNELLEGILKSLRPKSNSYHHYITQHSVEYGFVLSIAQSLSDMTHKKQPQTRTSGDLTVFETLKRALLLQPHGDKCRPINYYSQLTSVAKCLPCFHHNLTVLVPYAEASTL